MHCEIYNRESEKIEKQIPLVDRLVEHFNEDISEEIERYVTNTVFKYSRYIFVKRDRDKRCTGYIAYCTHCKEEHKISEFDAKEVFKHHNSCECPSCKSKCIAKHERYKRSQLIDRATFITYEKSKIDAQAIVAKGYFVERNYTGDYKEVTTEFKELSRFVFKVGKGYMMTKSWYRYSNGWYLRDGCRSYTDGYGNYRSYVDKDSIKRAVSNTELSYSPYEMYLARDYYGEDDDMTLFFYKYCKYPIVEKLVKSGFEIIAEYIVYGRSLERSVNFRQTDLFKFLGINRAEAKEILSSNVRCYPGFLNMYKFVKKEKLGWDIEKIKKISERYGIDTLKKIKEFAGINKVITYLDKQIPIEIKNFRSNIAKTWFDYINDCIKLRYDFTEKSILFPKNLEEAHQKTIKLVKYKADKILDEDIKEVAESLGKLKFGYKDLIIRPAKSSKELIKEGEKLNHCVGGYTKRYSEGESYILFIRKNNNQNKPYYTVEISKQFKVLQVHGKNNKSANEEVKEFMEVYQKEILEKLAKKNKKNKKAA